MYLKGHNECKTILCEEVIIESIQSFDFFHGWYRFTLYMELLYFIPGKRGNAAVSFTLLRKPVGATRTDHFSKRSTDYSCNGQSARIKTTITFLLVVLAIYLPAEKCI